VSARHQDAAPPQAAATQLCGPRTAPERGHLELLEVLGSAGASRAFRLRWDGGEASWAPRRGGALPIASGVVRQLCLRVALERLDLGAGVALLLECQRALASGGRLLLDLPDFDAALAAWRAADLTFFAASDEAALDDAALAWFCTYRHIDQPGWRVPRVPRAALHALRDRCSPQRLALELGIHVVDVEPPLELDRQSAWSRAELRELLRSVGFAVQREPPRGAGPTVSWVAVSVSDAPEAPEASTPVAADAALARALALARQDELAAAWRELGDAVAQQPSLAAAHYRLLWELHTRALRAQHRDSLPHSATFAAEGRHLGQVPAPIAAALRTAVERCSVVPVTAEDAAPGYLSNPNLSAAAAAAINRDNHYWQLTAEALRALGPALEHLSDAVHACLGTPWRVVNVRGWRTLTSAAPVEANGWHRDEPYPPSVLKVLLYLGAAGPDSGTTEVVRDDGSKVCAEGPAGTFQIFRNFELLHRGVPPRRGDRWALEITVAPHPHDDLRPVCAGQNADFPLSPWLDLAAWMPLQR
jgi:hypothetical protein